MRFKHVAICISAGLTLWPTAAVANPEFDCFAEASPNVVTEGTNGQSFSVKVYNGPSLPASVPIQEITTVRVIPPIGHVEATSASAPHPWTDIRLLGSDPTEVRYRGGAIGVGGSHVFSYTGDVLVTTHPGLHTNAYLVRGSVGTTSTRACLPVRPGALDLTINP